MRTTRLLAAALAAALATPPAHAHELWFRPDPGGDPARVRLSFGDSPAMGDAERVAEVADAKAWADGRPLEVRRLTDGLEARLPAPTPKILSASADRVVTVRGKSYLARCAAYAQSRPLGAGEGASLGLGDDQLRLLLVARDGGSPVVRATWKGKPVADAAVTLFRDGAEAVISRTDDRGEIRCPDLGRGPLWLRARVVDESPGRRDGKEYAEVRLEATLALLGGAGDAAVADCLERVAAVHGAAGPWAVVGYRIGERARKDLDLPRHSFDLFVVHRAPAEVQFSCVVDGLQASTGASLGKLNLKFEEQPRKAADVVPALSTVVEDRKSHRRLTFTLKPDLARSILDLPFGRLAAEGRRVAALPDDAIFEVRDESPERNR
jgi:hypothetical protein